MVTVPSGDGSLAAVIAGFALVGLAAPIAFVPVTSAAVDGVEATGLAAGLFNSAQQVGNAVAIAVLGTVAVTRTAALIEELERPQALAAGFRTAFVVAAAMLALGAAGAAALPGGRRAKDNGGLRS
jgi:hypothetical protein